MIRDALVHRQPPEVLGDLAAEVCAPVGQHLSVLDGVAGDVPDEAVEKLVGQAREITGESGSRRRPRGAHIPSVRRLGV